LIAFCLRLISILVLIVVLVGASQALLWLVKPWWPQSATSGRRLVVGKFDVVEGAQVQKERGEAFARLVSSRLRQIENILTKDLSTIAKSPDIVVEVVVPKQFDTLPAVETRLDFVEAKPFGIDIVGALTFLRRHLEQGDTLHGVVVLQKDKVEVFAEFTGDKVIGPWNLPTGAGLAEAADALSLRIRRELLKEDHPLASLKDDQFATFIEALDAYQRYALTSSADNKGTELLKRSGDLLESLQTQNVRCAPVYSYLASIRTLQPGPNIDSAIALLTRARTIDPKADYLAKRLEDLERRKPTVTAALVTTEASHDLLDQPSAKQVRLREALSTVSRKRGVRVCLLISGVDTSLDTLKGRIVAQRSFIPNESAIDDRLNHGTHVATYLATVAPSAQIILAKVVSETGSAPSVSLLEGLNFALEQRAEIVVIPLATTERSEAFAQVFEIASKKGLIVIASSGNGGSEEALYPASYPSVLGVGALDENNKRASYSNFGSHVALFAPGDALALTKDGRVESRKGTTYAAILVAAIAALVLETGVPPSEVLEILTKSAVPSSDSLKRVDALEAVSAAASKTQPPQTSK
jgi:Subtilase family